MTRSSLDKRFFESTRGKIVLLLRGSAQTVNDLAATLDLTDNAVRAHLLSLERDGLVVSGGTIKGFRKPHALFRLTDDARHIFPKPYDSLFNVLVGVLKRRLPDSLTSILHDVGSKAAATPTAEATLDERVETAVRSLEELGGAAVAQKHENGILIKSESCPFADAVIEHPEVCKIAEALVAETVGMPVTEVCDRKSFPRCRFEIKETSAVI
jgi:predicted ArsR family transcriptional regulator